MNKYFATLFMACCAILMGTAGSAPLIAAGPMPVTQDPVNPTLQLQGSVHRLNLWLADSSDAEVWRQNLMLNLLDAQSALGERADIATLARIDSRFSQSNAGLDKPVFRDVRDALKAQIKQLSEMHLTGLANLHDFQSAVATARSNFRPITIAAMDQQRWRAVNDLESLMKYYRKIMSSRKRANLFYDMQLDQTIDYLKGLEFELPPEVSVGKMDSMISNVKQQLRDIEEQIDAIPEKPQLEDGPEEDVEDEEEKKEDGQQDTIEPALKVYPPDFGPTPDDAGPSLDELERSQKNIEAKLKMLSKQRAEILKLDRPRLAKRRREFGQLREFESKLAGVSQTQTDPYFIAALTSLEQFVHSYRYGSDDNLQEEFLLKLLDLEESLLEIRGIDSREASAKLGETLGWLESANQVGPLVAAVRAKYSLPNFYLGVSGKLINQLGSKTDSQFAPVRQNFKGRLVRGNSRANSRVDLTLRNDPNQIHIDIGLTGSLAASTYVQQGKLQVFSTTAGCFSAQRSLFANIGGLLASEPKLGVNVAASYGGTSSRLGLVNRIAAKKFAESKAEAEEQTSSQTRNEIETQFTEQTDEAVSSGQAAIAKAQDALASNARLAPEIYLRTTDSQVVMIGKKSTPSSLAAQSFPSHSSVPTDVGVRIHESVFSNLFVRSFSGKTFSNEELAEQMGEMFGGEAPAGLAPASAPTPKDGEEGDDVKDESFSITFATVRPIQFEFENETLGVAISGRRFLQGDKKINTGLKIGLRFKIKRIDGKLKLVRDGKAELDYVGKKKDAKAVAFRSFLNGKLNPEKGGQQISIDLPDNLLPVDQLDSLKDNGLARRMTLVQCRSQNGWLYLGWNYTPENSLVQPLVDLPAIWTEAVVSNLNDVYIDSANVPAAPMTSSVEGVFAAPEIMNSNEPVLGAPVPISGF